MLFVYGTSNWFVHSEHVVKYLSMSSFYSFSYVVCIATCDDGP